MSNDTIPDAAESEPESNSSISISIVAGAVTIAESTTCKAADAVGSDAGRASMHTIPDDAPVISVSAIEVAPAVAPPLPVATAPLTPPRPAPVVAASAPAAASFVTAGGLVIPAPLGFVIAPPAAQAAPLPAFPAFPAPPALPSIPAFAPPTSLDATATRGFSISISDEGSLPPLTLSPDLDDLDFPVRPPSRSMMDSIWMPEDPVLTQKMEPEVAARRARFQRFVKGTVGGCAAMCVVAMFCTLVSHLSGDSANAAADTRATGAVAVAHAARTSVQTFEELDYGKAARGVTKSVRARSQARR